MRWIINAPEWTSSIRGEVNSIGLLHWPATRALHPVAVQSLDAMRLRIHLGFDPNLAIKHGSGAAALQIRRWRCDAARGAARAEDDDAHPIACGRSDIGQMLPVAIPARCGNREDGSCRCREADDFGE